MTTHQTHLSHPKYRPDIDGLRAVAVLAVVAFHAFPSWIRGGFIGVDVFFVISGYLISTIIFENLDKGTFSFTVFYARRIKRIFPSLLLVLITCFAFGWFALLADEYKQLGKHIAASAGFISNFVLWNEAGYFDNSAETKPLQHLWSLGIEEQFYILWPLMLWFAWKRKFNLFIITIIVATISFVFNIKGIKQDMVANFYSPQTRFWELLSGSLLAWIALFKKDAFANAKLNVNVWLSCIFCKNKEEGNGRTLANVLSFVGLFLLLYGFWRINKELSFPGKWALLPVLGTVLIITAGSKAWINRIILSNKIAVWFGLISFPLYLWHWPLLSFARIIEGGSPSSNIRIAAVILSIMLAWLTYRLLEGPIRLEKYNKTKVTFLVVLMTIVGYIGYNTYERDGLKYRAINKINDGVSKALSYDEKKGFRGGECFIDLDDKTNKFSSICAEIRTGVPSLLIWGDSHSASLYRGFESFAKSEKYALYQFNASGCPPILDFYINKRRECINSNKFVYKEIERLKPDTIVLSAYWSMYDGTEGWENLDTDKLIATISKLKSLGIKNIVLIGHLPVFTVNQAELLRRRTFFDNVPIRTYSKFKSTVYLYDKKIKDIASLTGIDFISPLDILCDANGCLLSATKKNILPFSFDYGHLNADGSNFLVSKFFELKQIKFSH
jgi:peptidoglycan/LPS O-acetylase OafA/YrhL